MAQNNELDRLVAIAQKFAAHNQVVNVQAFGSGNINDTFLVSLQPIEQEIEAKPFILQRINTNVFCEPKLVMQNMRIYGDHVRDRLVFHRETCRKYDAQFWRKRHHFCQSCRG